MIGVFGSGSWATAVAKIVLEHPNTTINWWIREPDIIEGIKETGHNPTYLSEIYFDTNQINFSNDISEVIKNNTEYPPETCKTISELIINALNVK